jgi:hypothetical protein
MAGMRQGAASKIVLVGSQVAAGVSGLETTAFPTDQSTDREKNMTRYPWRSIASDIYLVRKTWLRLMSDFFARLA